MTVAIGYNKFIWWRLSGYGKNAWPDLAYMKPKLTTTVMIYEQYA